MPRILSMTRCEGGAHVTITVEEGESTRDVPCLYDELMSDTAVPGEDWVVGYVRTLRMAQGATDWNGIKAAVGVE